MWISPPLPGARHDIGAARKDGIIDAIAAHQIPAVADTAYQGAGPTDAVPQFLPEGPGQVLITSRNPAWRGIADTVGVREFTRAESIALLRRLAPELTEAEADRVADAVGDLPLAVEQAGSLLADTGMAVDEYLRLLGERAQDVLDHDPGGAYPQSVAASWAVAFDRLAADDPTGGAQLQGPLDNMAAISVARHAGV